MSNLFGPGDRSRAGPLLCRPARREELHRGLRMVLGSHGRPAGDGDVLEFLRTAVQRRIDPGVLWVAEQGGHLVWAVLPLVSPGRTMLLFCPGGARHPEAAPQALITAVCDHYRQRGIHLAQVLLDPSDTALATRFHSAGFQLMTELVYMQKQVRRAEPAQLPPGVRCISHCPELEGTFRRTIVETYQDSLDCPALNGLRDIEDVLAGHRATGEFDPSLWSLLYVNDGPVGVMLLSRLEHAGSMELVYFGLVPLARGCGLGDVAMRHVIEQVGRCQSSRLSLAVDATNAPAIKLYSRHGLYRVGSKQALLRDLRRETVPV